jgi:hypothetical protein
MWRGLVIITTESSVSRLFKEYIITLQNSDTVYVIYIKKMRLTRRGLFLLAHWTWNRERS